MGSNIAIGVYGARWGQERSGESLCKVYDCLTTKTYTRSPCRIKLRKRKGRRPHLTGGRVQEGRRTHRRTRPLPSPLCVDRWTPCPYHVCFWKLVPSNQVLQSSPPGSLWPCPQVRGPGGLCRHQGEARGSSSHWVTEPVPHQPRLEAAGSGSSHLCPGSWEAAGWPAPCVPGPLLTPLSQPQSPRGQAAKCPRPNH